jgi:lipopolysaccharide transport system permease protein
VAVGSTDRPRQAPAAGLAEPSSPPTVRLQATRGLGRVISPRELWRYRDLGLQIAARDLTVRYRQTILGALWAVLQPVLIMVVFTIFFGHFAHVSSEGVPYPLFALAALVPWTFFANALQLGSESLVGNSALVSKVYFPRVLIPGGVIAAGIVDFAVGWTILLGVVLVTGSGPSLAILAVPLLALIAIAAALGVTAGLAALNVRYRDVRYVVPFTIQLWLFATPIAYPSTLLHAPLRTLLAINPMAGVVEGFRWAMLDHLHAPWAMIGVSAASAVVLLGAGLTYFSRVERSFADII